MFFAYGWPRALAAFEGAGQEDVVYLHLDSDYSLIVSTGSVQIWTGGQHRIRLGHLAREETTLKNEGLNKCAYWCSSRRLLAVLVITSGRRSALSTELSKESEQFGPVNEAGASRSADGAVLRRPTTMCCSSMACTSPRIQHCRPPDLEREGWVL